MNKIKELTQGATSGTGHKFFASTSRGEMQELVQDLNSNDKDKQRFAIKRIIATMTLGKDVSRLFADVVKLSKTPSLEIKKLVYLYIVTNARLASDKAILAVNTFVMDCRNEHPVVRALAIRTMLCVRVEGIADYTMEPLRRALSDSDAYVRRTAAVGLGKVYHNAPKLFAEQNFLENVYNLLSDSVPMVVSAAASTLAELLQNGCPTKGGPALTEPMVNKLLNALPECYEWGQCRILDLLAHYRPKGPEDTDTILERVAPRLAHANPSVVLAAGKVISLILDLASESARQTYMSKVANAYVTLLGANAAPIEVQFVICRDVYVLLHKFPSMFLNHTKAFLVRYNDPTYLKLEKIGVMLRLLSSKNTPGIVQELVQYSNDVVDIPFLKAVIRALGLVAIRVEAQSAPCIEHLLRLAGAGGPEVQNDVICVLKDILRKYPRMHGHILPFLFGNTESSAGLALESHVENPDALHAVVWMLGEFSDQIPSAPQVLANYLQAIDVLTQGSGVQLAILTATIKMFLCNPPMMENILREVLNMYLQRATNPDVRDRAMVFYRLLTDESCADKLGAVVLGAKSTVEVDTTSLDMTKIGDFLRCLNTVACVHRELPASFLPKYGVPAGGSSVHDIDDDDDIEEITTPTTPVDQQPTLTGGNTTANNNNGHTTTKPLSPPSQGTNGAPPPQSLPQPPRYVDPLDDIFGGGSSKQSPVTPNAPNNRPNTTPTSAPPSGGIDDLFASPTKQAAVPRQLPTDLPPIVLAEGPGKGLLIRGRLIDVGEHFVAALELHFENRAVHPFTDFALQVNKSVHGFRTVEALRQQMSAPLLPLQSHTVTMPLQYVASHVETAGVEAVEVALKCNIGILYFNVPIPPEYMYKRVKEYNKKDFAASWRAIDNAKERRFPFPMSTALASAEALQAVLQTKCRACFVARRPTPEHDNLYFVFQHQSGEWVYLEVVLIPSSAEHSYCCAKADNASQVSILQVAITTALKI